MYGRPGVSIRKVLRDNRQGEGANSWDVRHARRVKS